MKSLFLITFRRVTSSSRLLMMGGLALVPFVVTAIMISFPGAAPLALFEGMILNAMLIGAIVPLMALATARAAFGDEIGDRTLANVTLTPFPRWKIVLPKLLAVVAFPALVVAGSAGLTTFVAYGGDLTATGSATFGAVTSVLLYSALFVWLDLVTPHAVGIGLAYIVVWEGLFSSFIYGVRFLSLRGYSLSITHGLDARRFAEDSHVPIALSLALAVAALAGLFLLSARRLRTMDIP